jgi:uncharacterized protein
MIRAVLDTNVVVSALISPFGNEAVVIHGVYTGRVAPCYSKAIAEEYANVLAREKFGFAQDEIQCLLELFSVTGVLAEPRGKLRVSPDPKDDAFIACAIASAAEFLVTGNKQHFPAASYGSAKVVSAREFLDILNTPQSP